MKHISIRGRHAALMCGVLWLGVSGVHAQQETKPAEEQPQVLAIRKLEGIGPRCMLYTPQYQSSSPVGRAQSRLWCQVLVSFDTAPEWMDEIGFQFFVLLKKEEKGKPEYNLFRGSVSCIDVQKGRLHQTAMLLRPSALTRYGEVVGVAVEVNYKGAVIVTKDEAATQEIAHEKEWWKNPKLVVRDGYLVNRMQTPFACVNFDEFELIKQ